MASPEAVGDEQVRRRFFTLLNESDELKRLSGSSRVIVSVPGKSKDLKDETIKAFVRNDAGVPLAVAICSSPLAPGVIWQGADLAAEIRQLVGPELAPPVLLPLLRGRLDDLTFAVWPYRHELPERRLAWVPRRFLLLPSVLRWLRGVSKATMMPADPADFARPIEAIVADDAIGTEIRRVGREALERLESGRWIPMHVAEHNDLWRGNFLLEATDWFPQSRYPFVIIDWSGANVRGFGLSDLVRVGLSFKLSRRRFREQIRAHCDLLEVPIGDAAGPLLAGLGHLSLNRNYFPRPRYVALVEACYRYLSACLR